MKLELGVFLTTSRLCRWVNRGLSSGWSKFENLLTSLIMRQSLQKHVQTTYFEVTSILSKSIINTARSNPNDVGNTRKLLGELVGAPRTHSSKFGTLRHRLVFGFFAGIFFGMTIEYEPCGTPDAGNINLLNTGQYLVKL